MKRAAVLLARLSTLLCLTTAAAAERPNLLLILVDDLKPSFGAYGDAWVHSPNLDRLAASGMRFDRAYCNQAVCAPSRNNLLVGSRSTSLGVYSLGLHFRHAAPDAVTLPQYFKQHGYHTAGIGKVFHIGHGNVDDAHSWSVPFQPDKVIDYVLPESTGGRLTREEAFFSNRSPRGLPRGAAWEKADVDDGAYADGRIAAEGIERLRAYRESDQPFFLALGFTKPHLPFCAPKKYWDLYDPAKLPLPEHTRPPAGAPPYAGKTLGELNQYEPVPQNPPLDEDLQRTLIHGYYAALSYMDAQVGRVLNELEQLGLEENTIIVLWGDHGYHLGDHGMWTKHTNYEQANRIPLLIRAPGVTKPGSASPALVETVDVFPTLTELAGLPPPSGPQPIDGKSLTPILQDSAASVRDHAYHCYPRGNRLGRAIRTERHRLVEWKPFGSDTEPEYELYDYEEDRGETKNLAAAQPEVVARLGAMLAKHPEAKHPHPPPDKIPVLLDTDLGGAVDDAFALALLLASPEVDLRGITTVGTQAEDRAWMACRLLTHAGRREIPVAFGRAPQPESSLGGQIQYRRHPAVVWDRTARPQEAPAVEFLYQQLKAEPGKLTLVALGPLTNIARLFEAHPEAKAWVKRIVLMGGSLRRGYDGEAPAAGEWNIRSDVQAAQAVFASGVPLVAAPLDATVDLKLDPERRAKLYAACTPLTFQLQALDQLHGEEAPTLFDPLAAALVFEERFCEFDEVRLTVDDQGFTRTSSGEPNVRIATSTRAAEFLDWLVNRIAAHGQRNLPSPPENVAMPVDRGGLPSLVHVFEDYESDIEKRWWLAGRLENEDTPRGSRRACRSVITQDFDAKQGDTATAYSAVVFNPVPGPPMGENPRLAIRYKLRGTDTLRIQLYSLSNGYHRYLSLKGLPQGEWRSAAVDMTQMRRPDGGGGPLSKDERIDDIQFYVDPRAEALIDDVVLYDAAPEGEKRPFPKRILFTGWFDTGEQGREWPGDFEIVLHEPPRTWDAARSVPHAKTGEPWLRIHLRGPRRLDELVRLRFQYRLSGGSSLKAALVDSESGASYRAEVATPATGAWSEAFVDFPIPATGKELYVDEIHLTADKGAELLVDISCFMCRASDTTVTLLAAGAV